MDSRNFVTQGRKDFERDEEGHKRVCAGRPRNVTIFEVSHAVPKGVICLLSALELYGLAREPSGSIWVAIENKARQPSQLPEGTHVVRFSSAALEAGKRRVLIPGVGEISVHTPAKAIVDCFKFRGKLATQAGQQLADLINILRDATGAYKSKKKVSIKAIRQYLEVCRMVNVMSPYLEAMEDRREITKDHRPPR